MIYGYCRVSTDEQARSGLGLDAQRTAIADETARRGWPDPELIVDEGVSGGIAPDDRPALGPALERLAPGDVLIAAKIDRLGRSAFAFLDLAARAEREGWSLVVLDVDLDMTSPIGKFTATILAAVAELERRMIAQRTSDAMQAAKRRGVRFGEHMIGTPDDVRQRIADERDAGASLRTIADGLNDDGVPTAQGGARWYASSVRAVLRSLELDAEAAAAREGAAA